MPIKLITNFNILMKKAHRLGKAKLVKNPNPAQKEELIVAELDHAIYRDLCLKADEVTI